MGMSASVRLVVGVPYRHAVRKDMSKRTETRYDEKTGKPYGKEIVEERLMLGNVIIDPDSDWMYLPLYKDSGLELFDPGFDRLDEAGAVVGVLACKTEDLCHDAGTVRVAVEKMEEARKAALRAFLALGIDESNLDWFLVPSVG